ncbi:hypothetical protein ACP4OV_028028 [Aristida adscensionis]
MVCMSGQFKMASVLKLVLMENHAARDDVINEMAAAQILQKQLFDAHEPNLLNEDDMHIFGSKPMADPLDLVCCSTCKKPVKASQYAVHAERCNSGKVNTNDSMSLDDYPSPTKSSKKGKKIKLTNPKVQIKLKAKSQPESKDNANGFELDNGHIRKAQPTDSTANQNAPVPLATKMYHSQGNYRLRLELGQLYRQSCADHLGSHPTPTNSSQENGLMVSQFSPCDNSALNGAQKNLPSQTKVLASASESCSGIPQQLSSGPNCSRETKSERADMHVSAMKNETSRSRGNKAAIPHSKSKGNKKTHKQSNGPVHVIKSSVE